MPIDNFTLHRKGRGADCLQGLWGPGPPGRLWYDMANPGKGNHATRVGGDPQWFFDPDRKFVPLFNGVNQCYDCERRLGIGTDAFTLCAWVWLDSTVGQDDPGIICQMSSGVRGWRFFVLGGNGANAALAFRGVGTIATAPLGSFHVVKNQWVHVAVSRTHIRFGAPLTLHQDGQHVATDPTALNDYSPDMLPYIGSGYKRPNGWWKGLITDVRFYRRGLSNAQISHIYERTRYHPYDDLTAHPTWRYHQRHRAGPN